MDKSIKVTLNPDQPYCGFEIGVEYVLSYIRTSLIFIGIFKGFEEFEKTTLALFHSDEGELNIDIEFLKNYEVFREIN